MRLPVINDVSIHSVRVSICWYVKSQPSADAQDLQHKQLSALSCSQRLLQLCAGVACLILDEDPIGRMTTAVDNFVEA